MKQTRQLPIPPPKRIQAEQYLHRQLQVTKFRNFNLSDYNPIIINTKIHFIVEFLQLKIWMEEILGVTIPLTDVAGEWNMQKALQVNK